MKKLLVISTSLFAVLAAVGIFLALQKHQQKEILPSVSSTFLFSTSTFFTAATTSSTDYSKLGKDTIYTEEEGKYEQLNTEERLAISDSVSVRGEYGEYAIAKESLRLLALKNGYALLCIEYLNQINHCSLFDLKRDREIRPDIFIHYTEGGGDRMVRIGKKSVAIITDSGIFYYAPGMPEIPIFLGSALPFSETYFYSEDIKTFRVSTSFQNNVLSVSVFKNHQGWLEDMTSIPIRKNSFIVSQKSFAVSVATSTSFSTANRPSNPIRREDRIYDDTESRFWSLNGNEKEAVAKVMSANMGTNESWVYTEEENPQLISFKNGIILLSHRTQEKTNIFKRNYVLIDTIKNIEIPFPVPRKPTDDAFQLTDNIFLFLQDAGIVYYSPGMTEFSVIKDSTLPADLSYSYDSSTLYNPSFSEVSYQDNILKIALFPRDEKWSENTGHAKKIGEKTFVIPVEPLHRESPFGGRDFLQIGKDTLYTETGGLYSNISTTERELLNWLSKTFICNKDTRGACGEYATWNAAVYPGVQIIALKGGHLLVRVPDSKGGINYDLINLHSLPPTRERIYGMGLQTEKIIIFNNGNEGLLYYKPGMSSLEKIPHSDEGIERGREFYGSDGSGWLPVAGFQINSDILTVTVSSTYDEKTSTYKKVRDATFDLSTLP